MSNQEKKAYLKAYLQDIALVLKKNQQKKNVKWDEFQYDGGFMGVVIYYNKKYRLGIPLNDGFKYINGNSFYSINFNLYRHLKDYSKNKNDLFKSDYLKKYFLKGENQSFKNQFSNLMDSYQKKEHDQLGNPVWTSDILKILLAFIAFQENYKLGFTRKDYLRSKKKFDKILKEYTKEFIVIPKLEDRHILATWLLNLYDSSSSESQRLSQALTLKLLQKEKVKVPGGTLWWKHSDQKDQIRNWMAYGIMRDYLDKNSQTFIKKYPILKFKTKIKPIKAIKKPAKSIKPIKPIKPIKKTKSDDLNENFMSRLERVDQKKKELSEKTHDYPTWKVTLAWVLFPILIYISFRIFLYMSSKLFSLKMINE